MRFQKCPEIQEIPNFRDSKWRIQLCRANYTIHTSNDVVRFIMGTAKETVLDVLCAL